MSLVQELEEYGGDPSNIVLSRKCVSGRRHICWLIHSLSIGTFSKSPDSDSSGSTASDDVNEVQHPYTSPSRQRDQAEKHELGSDQEDSEDEARELPAVHAEPAVSQTNRPQSSLSSQRYRTPMTASLAVSPPPAQRIPVTQPLPNFQTPSVFAEPSPASSMSYPPTASSYAGQFSESSRGELTTPTHLYPAHHQYGIRTPSRPVHYGPASRLTLEHAVENVQAHMAALTERLESLETSTNLSQSHISHSPRRIGSPGRGRGRGSPSSGRNTRWDIDDLGLWSLVLNPLSRGLDALREFLTFFARNENRSPTSIIVRRLCLDISFLVCVVAVVRALWRKSGVRRREVRAALVVLWRAILGTKPRMMVDQGV